MSYIYCCRYFRVYLQLTLRSLFKISYVLQLIYMFALAWFILLCIV